MEKRSDFFEAQSATRAMILKANLDAEKAFLDQYTKLQSDAVEKATKNEADAYEELLKWKNKRRVATSAEEQADLDKQIAKQSKIYDDLKAARKRADDEYFSARKANEDRARKASEIAELNSYKYMSTAEKQSYARDIQLKIKQKQVALKKEIQDTRDAIAAEDAIINDPNRSQADKDSAKQRKDSLAASLSEKQDIENTLKDQARKAPSISKLQGLLPGNLAETKANAKEQLKLAVQAKQIAKAQQQEALDKINSNKKLKKDFEALQAAKKRGNEEEIRIAKQRLKDSEEYQAYIQAEDDLRDAAHEEEMARSQERTASALQTAGKVADKIGGSIEDNLGVLYGSQSKMMGRLQGSAIEWSDAVRDVSATIGMSGVVSKKNVIQKMVELVDSGVAYNLEMRAFLAETAQDIASTFDATNGTLLRMIRLQQADTTAARLGMEASLTKLFNNFFEDSSYLAGQVSDAISDKILDASATMSHDNAVEFEYVLQKWLGSLYSVGMSQSAVELIAEGINYLGTGNVNALNSNDTLQTLFAMSAARSGGKSYADLLLGGIDSTETNKLLRGMITYLAEIASNQTNYVTKAAYADLFGMSVTDLSVFASLTADEITRLYDNTLTYNNMLGETEHQLRQIITRRSLSQLVDTAIDNAEMGAAATIGSNAFTYGTWKAINVLQEYVGEIKIPSFLTYGTGLSSDIDLLNVAKTGMVGIGMLGSLLEGIGSMLSGGPTILSNWSGSEFTHRGSGLKILDTGALKTSSYSAVIGVGSASGEDVQQASLTSATSTAYENSNTSEEDVEEGKEIPKKIYELIGGDTQETVVGMLSKIHRVVENLADPYRVSYTAITGVVSNNSLSTLSNLANDVTTQYYRNGVSAAVKTDDNPTDVAKPGIKFTSASGTSQNIEVDSVESVLQTAITKAVETAITAALQSVTTKVSIAGVEAGVNLLGGY